MGFFSWITQDTNESIANSSSYRSTFTVYMTDDKGNKWKEDNYEGYGVFGGKDYYELLAEMNGETTRNYEINLEYGKDHKEVKFPNLSQNKNWKWINEKPKNCPDQGYFYFDEEDYDNDDIL